MNDFTHITGTFVINAPGSFLNGAGLEEGENRNVSIVKTYRDGRFRITICFCSGMETLATSNVNRRNWLDS